jgi:hypothetical protein
LYEERVPRIMQELSRDMDTLLKHISKKREEMIDCAKKTGLTSNETIRCSQELDKLLNQYQFYMREKRNKWYSLFINRSHSLYLLK